MKTILIIFAALLLLIGLAPLDGGRVFRRSSGSLISDGVKRKYLLYVPASYDSTKPTPLVISLHGFKDYPTQQMRKSGWNILAEQEGFIVVYPLGSNVPPAWQLYDYKNPAANHTVSKLPGYPRHPHLHTAGKSQYDLCLCALGIDRPYS